MPIPPERVHRLAKAGHIFAIGERTVIGFDQTDPLTDERRFCILSVYPEDQIPSRLLRELAVSIEAKRVVLRTSPTDQEGPEKLATYVSIEPGLIAPTEVTLLRTDRSNWPFVRHLLCLALTKGYDAYGLKPDTQKIELFVEENWGKPLQNGDGWSWVAPVESDLAGHITAVRSQDGLTGRDFIEIVDVFVINKYAGRGLSVALTSKLASEVVDHELPLLGHVVHDADNSRRVLQKLTAEGWTKEWELWTEPR